LLASLFVSP